MSLRRCILFAALLLLAACDEDTGGQLIAFHAYAAGPLEAQGTLQFSSAGGYTVQLASARMHIGALYMRLGQTDPGSANASCVGDTSYGLQVPGPGDFDLLSSQPQEFSVLGQATSELDQSGEIWLHGGDINQLADRTVLVAASGVALQAGRAFPFTVDLTIGENRLIAPTNPAMPGQSPICKQRIIVPIPLQITPTPGGNLLLRIDPRHWFDEIDFASLPSAADGVTRVVPDRTDGPDSEALASRSFFKAVTGASAAVYQFSWLEP